METAEIILLTVFIGLIVFLIGIYIGVAVAMEQDEEKQKERMRKTKAYELGQEEERNSASESANNFVIGRDEEDVKKDATYDIIDIACALVNLSDVEIERLENEENLTEEESKKLIHLLRCKVKRLEKGLNTQKLVCPGLYDNAYEKYIEVLEQHNEDLKNKIKRLNRQLRNIKQNLHKRR